MSTGYREPTYYPQPPPSRNGLVAGLVVSVVILAIALLALMAWAWWKIPEPSDTPPPSVSSVPASTVATTAPTTVATTASE